MTVKDTKGKTKLNLVPIRAKAAVARVREFGTEKYPIGGPNNYLYEVDPIDLVEAASRHIDKHLLGDLLDNESSEMHLAHAATSLMMAMEILYYGMESDKRSLRDTQLNHKFFAALSNTGGLAPEEFPKVQRQPK